MNSRPTSRPRAHLVVLVLVVAGILAWLALRERERPANVLELDGTQAANDGDTTQVAPIAPDGGAATRRADAIVEPERAIEAAKLAPVASDDAQGALALELEFHWPDGRQHEIARATVRVVDGAGLTRTQQVASADVASFTGLAVGTWRIEVEGDDFTHEPLHVDAAARLAEDLVLRRRDGDAVVHERALLWPDRWLRVYVETSGGRPLDAFAAQRGLDATSLFHGAFQLIASLDAPTSPFAAGDWDPSAASFHRLDASDRWRMEGGECGALQTWRATPFWTRLDLFGAPIGWEVAEPASKTLTFRVDPTELESRFARVALRVIDAKTRAAATDARVTLLSDATIHRRADLEDVPVRADGGVELAHVVPGRYELTIARGETHDQRMIELATRELRDLGDVAIGTSPGIDVLVVDAQGRPVSAWVEIGAFSADTLEHRLYPPTLRHRSGDDGVAHLPMPNETSVVRAMVEDESVPAGFRVRESWASTRSANVRVDPRDAPNAPLQLVVKRVVPVHVQTKRADVARVDVLDESDVVVARDREMRNVRFALVEGRYRVRGLAADGAKVLERTLKVGSEPVVLEL